jgi:hypothetical protein
VRGRRRLAAAPLLAALAYLGLTLAWSAHEAPRRGEAFAPGSVWSSREEGYSLAFAYLAAQAEARGAPPVRVLDRRTPVADLPSRGVVFRVQPLDDAEGAVVRGADEAWVAQGGRLVLILDRPYRGFEPVPFSAARRVVRTFPWGGGEWRYRPNPPRGLAVTGALELGHTLYAAGELPLAVRRHLGAGEIMVFASPEAFSNHGLGKADHLAILAELAGDRPVLFDESSHGTTRGARVLGLLSSWGLGPALAALGLVALVYLWRAGTRIGPAEREPGEDRSEAVDLVDSLADLYGRALGRNDAVALYAEGLARTVTIETGLAEAAAHARARALAPAAHELDETKDLGRNEFATALEQLNNAYDQVEHARHR